MPLPVGTRVMATDRDRLTLQGFEQRDGVAWSAVPWGAIVFRRPHADGGLALGIEYIVGSSVSRQAQGISCLINGREVESWVDHEAAPVVRKRVLPLVDVDSVDLIAVSFRVSGRSDAEGAATDFAVVALSLIPA